MNSSPLHKKDPSLWVCAECEHPLEQQSIQAFYLEHAFSTTPPTCPRCAFVLVPKSIAEGKMFEAEQSMELHRQVRMEKTTEQSVKKASPRTPLSSL